MNDTDSSEIVNSLESIRGSFHDLNRTMDDLYLLMEKNQEKKPKQMPISAKQLDEVAEYEHQAMLKRMKPNEQDKWLRDRDLDWWLKTYRQYESKGSLNYSYMIDAKYKKDNK